MVLEVVLGTLIMYCVMGRDTGGFLCTYSGNTGGIKMAVPKSGLFLTLALEKSCCLGIFSVYGNVYTWVSSAEGNLFLILTRKESGIFQTAYFVLWANHTKCVPHSS